MRFCLPKAAIAGIIGLSSLAAITSPQVKAQANKPIKTTPATADQVDTYARISILTFCEARRLKINFTNSMILAVTGQGRVIFGKHGGIVPGSTKPLTQEQFLNNASFMTISGALQGCPSQVPAEEKKKFDEVVKKIKESRK